MIKNEASFLLKIILSGLSIIRENRENYIMQNFRLYSIAYTPESLPIHIVMLRDDGNSGLLLRLTGADDDSFNGCCCGTNDLALVTVDRPTKQIP